MTLAAGVDCVHACASVSMQLEPANTEALMTQKIRKAANTSQCCVYHTFLCVTHMPSLIGY